MQKGCKSSAGPPRVCGIALVPWVWEFLQQRHKAWEEVPDQLCQFACEFQLLQVFPCILSRYFYSCFMVRPPLFYGCACQDHFMKRLRVNEFENEFLPTRKKTYTLHIGPAMFLSYIANVRNYLNSLFIIWSQGGFFVSLSHQPPLQVGVCKRPPKGPLILARLKGGCRKLFYWLPLKSGSFTIFFS